jgi:hypothetical protein
MLVGLEIVGQMIDAGGDHGAHAINQASLGVRRAPGQAVGTRIMQRNDSSILSCTSAVGCAHALSTRFALCAHAL